MYGLAYVMMFVVQMMPHFLAMLREKEIESTEKLGGSNVRSSEYQSDTLTNKPRAHRRGAIN